ncbi:MAG TPA: hypothetical protein PLM14_01390 [Candidatus Hydrogenedentes bacterium]|nr:hypothetical protein [Candidatus Hydrogenedentota bacterium]HQH52822.1 hypothetical protein [Candidatus Hydrogenedentota bacterium]
MSRNRLKDSCRNRSICRGTVLFEYAALSELEREIPGSNPA